MKTANYILTCFAITILLIAACNTKTGNSWTVTSPGGALKASVIEENGKLFYCVMIDADTVIKKSAMGITMADEDYTKDLKFSGISTNKIDERYTMVIGKRLKNHAVANEMTLSFGNARDSLMEIVFRVYDEGVGFCYRFPNAKEKTTVIGESTTFTVPVNGKAWLQSYGLPAQWAPAYEEMYRNRIPIGQPAPDTSGYSFAALFQNYNHWLLLTESGLDRNFYGSHLQQHCENGIYRIAAPQTGEANGKYDNVAVRSLETPDNSNKFQTPWRTLLIGRSLGSIIESNLVYHLSQPSMINDVSWIRPGRSSWSWWSDHPSSKNYNSLKKYVDLSKTMGWEYSLVDANWDIMKGGNIEQLINYARGQGIGLALWYNSAGPHSDITERPRDIMSDPLKRKEEFRKLNEWGIKTVKVDFFNSDKQALINLYLDILKDAAAEKIMVVTHGCTLPRGWSRTWPNLLSMEAVHGAEQYGWDMVFARESPKQNIIYACTRNVVGPMDYTPVTLSSYPCCTHATSNAYELALPVLFESGVTHFADAAENFLKTDSVVKSYLRTVPTVWDDTKFIQGYPGRELIIARQKGRDWYIAAVNGEAVSKNFKLDLGFLPKGNYQFTIIKDGATPSEVISQQVGYNTGDAMQLPVLPNGGFVIRAVKNG